MVQDDESAGLDGTRVRCETRPRLSSNSRTRHASSTTNTEAPVGPNWNARLLTLAFAVIVFPKGSTLTARVNAALKAMIDDGTIVNLQRRWLDADLTRIRVVR